MIYSYILSFITYHLYHKTVINMLLTWLEVTNIF